MATNKQLEAQLRALQELLEQHGIASPTTEAVQPEDRGDYIEHGSPGHAALLGVVVVEDLAQAEKDGYYVCKDDNGTHYRLEDQVSPYMGYPDPAQIAKLTLRQKVSELEHGKPPRPENAPPMWRPLEVR